MNAIFVSSIKKDFGCLENIRYQLFFFLDSETFFVVRFIQINFLVLFRKMIKRFGVEQTDRDTFIVNIVRLVRHWIYSLM